MSVSDVVVIPGSYVDAMTGVGPVLSAVVDNPNQRSSLRHGHERYEGAGVSDPPRESAWREEFGLVTDPLVPGLEDVSGRSATTGPLGPAWHAGEHIYEPLPLGFVDELTADLAHREDESAYWPATVDAVFAAGDFVM